MGYLLKDTQWNVIGGNPKVLLDISYDQTRADTNSSSLSGTLSVYLRTQSTASATYFNYPITVQMWIAGTLVYSEVAKANGVNLRTNPIIVSRTITFDKAWEDYTVSVRVVDSGHSQTDDHTYDFTIAPPRYAPGNPGRQYINGSHDAVINERTHQFTLSWDRPSTGSAGITGYAIYWSKGAGWQPIGYVTAEHTSAVISLNGFYNEMPRGSKIGFQVLACNAYTTSAPMPKYLDNNTLTLANVNVQTTVPNKTPNTITVNWTSNVLAKSIYYRLGTTGNWTQVQSGIQASSGTFNITQGLEPNTKYTVQVLCRGYEGTTGLNDGTTQFTVTTKDIAKITNTDLRFNIESPMTINITPSGSLRLDLFVVCNGVEILGVENINNNTELTSYIWTLLQSEKNSIYTNYKSEFKLLLKTHSNGIIYTYEVPISFVLEARAWVRPTTTPNWTRALVWTRANSLDTWKRALVWVDPNDDKNWKRA